MKPENVNRNAARGAPQMNRVRILLLIFAALLASRACFATLPEPWVAGTGQFRGALLEVWVTPGEHMRPRWNPEKGVWPMSAQVAVEAARKSLRLMVGEDHQHFVCDTISLKRFFTHPSEDSASFYFLVVFESAHESQITRKHASGYAPAIIPFIVFPDGHVNLPENKKTPNKAPEPTSHSVTPRAAERPVK
jgi:hypothetical protein